MYCIYGSLVYLAFGNMKESSVLLLLPDDSIVVKFMIFSMVIVMMCGYPLTIFPANMILE